MLNKRSPAPPLHHAARPPPPGIPELRRAICAFHQRYDGLDLLQEGMVVGPGSKELIYLIMAVFNGGMIS